MKKQQRKPGVSTKAGLTRTKTPKKRTAPKKTTAATRTRAVTKQVNYAKKYANEMQRLRPIVQGLLLKASPGATGDASLNRKIALGLVHSPPTHSMINNYFNNHHNYPIQFRRFRRHLYDYPNFASGFYHGRSFK